MTLGPALPEVELLRWIADSRALLDRLETMVAPAQTSGETMDEWFDRWNADRAQRGHDAEHEQLTYRRWIAPRLGILPVTGQLRGPVDEWVHWIEGRVDDGALHSTTAWRVWTVLAAMLRDMYAARNRALRVRVDNPAPDVRGPPRGTPRVGTFLYPSEFLRLVSCARVSLVERRLYAVAVYLYPRLGELAALRWEDIDLPTGRVHIHRSVTRIGIEKSLKRGEDRQFVAERTLLPLLRAMRRGARGDVLFSDIDRQNAAPNLRAALRRAGCKRADLYADDERRRPLTFHDLRATGITWQAMRGDSPTAILERVGHTHLSTTERYLRRGRLMALAQGERVFPPLPQQLLGRAKK